MFSSRKRRWLLGALIATIVIVAVAAAMVFRHDIWPIPAGQGRVVVTCERGKGSVAWVKSDTTGSLVAVVNLDWTGEGSANLPPGDYFVGDDGSISLCTSQTFHLSAAETIHVESPSGIGPLGA